MALGDHDGRGRRAATERPASEQVRSIAIAIVLGLVTGALLMGLLAFYYARQIPTSETPTVTTPETQPSTPTPPASTTPTPAPTPSTK